jgi:hypothetical protein
MKPIISQAELDEFFKDCKTPDERFSKMITAMLRTPPLTKKPKPPKGDLGSRYAFFIVRFLDTK